MTYGITLVITTRARAFMAMHYCGYPKGIPLKVLWFQTKSVEHATTIMQIMISDNNFFEKWKDLEFSVTSVGTQYNMKLIHSTETSGGIPVFFFIFSFSQYWIFLFLLH